ncbi:hypothetical protein ETAA8_02590 [Anatilimnocola aggregata]|uniref:Uncharacterized protein n=1 Tax=Anatilimnocola aggregata TaxID=2528021 RepID=A0A517Y4S1_9BACT|nr:hypothetical protein [Anatilimnocola aggregata]QDU25196.1 hypothetical protein ETAA8_02590 [Anatilimnocola aggregata]
MRQARKHPSGRGFQRLAMEKLEDRSLMAGNVTAVVTNGVLVVTGDTADNGITIDYNQTTDAYSVIGTTPTGSTATTINGLDTSVPANAQIFNNVTKGIRVIANNGNDLLVFGAATSTSFVVDGFVDIQMGNGNDTVTIGRNGNAAGGAAPIANEFEVGTTMAIKLGSGNDTLDITNASIARDLTIHADVNNPLNTATDGNDTVRFPTTFTPSGGELTAFPVTVGKKTTVLLGGGADTFNGANLRARGGMFVQDLGANLNFDLVDTVVGGELKLQKTGGSANDILIDNVQAGTLRISTGNAVDTIAVRDSIFERMYIESGGGVDRITIGNTRVRKLGLIDGGREKARLIQEGGNTLRGVVKIKTFTN